MYTYIYIYICIIYTYIIYISYILYIYYVSTCLHHWPLVPDMESSWPSGEASEKGQWGVRSQTVNGFINLEMGASPCMFSTKPSWGVRIFFSKQHPWWRTPLWLCLSLSLVRDWCTCWQQIESQELLASPAFEAILIVLIGVGPKGFLFQPWFTTDHYVISWG